MKVAEDAVKTMADSITSSTSPDQVRPTVPAVSVTANADVETVVTDDTAQDVSDSAEKPNSQDVTDPVVLYQLLRSAADSFSMPDKVEDTSELLSSEQSDKPSGLDDVLIGDDDQFSRVTQNREEFNRYMKKAFTHIREAAIVEGANTARKVSHATVRGQKLADAFYAANPDLIPHREVVRQMTASIAAANPFYNSDPAALMVASAAATRQYIAMRSQPNNVSNLLSKPQAPVKKTASGARSSVVKPDDKNQQLMTALFGKK